jgi:surface antigen
MSRAKRAFSLASVCALLSSFVLQGCAEQGMSANEVFTKENIGTLAGAAGGAWIGSNVGKGKGNIVAIAAGTLLGGALGRSLGASLDRADMAKYNKTSQYALENTKTGTTSSWHNPDSGHSGTFTPTRTFERTDGAYCREYTQMIDVGGRNAEGHGTACRQPDGTWQIVN